jgi:holin-like protein
LSVLLACQLAGEVLAKLLDLPIPGPVLGMVLLFAGLMASRREHPAFAATARGLLGHLSLLFVPAGTGVVTYLAVLRAEWLSIGAGLIGSTVLTMAVTAWLMVAFARRASPAETKSSPETRS